MTPGPSAGRLGLGGARKAITQVASWVFLGSCFLASCGPPPSPGEPQAEAPSVARSSPPKPPPAVETLRLLELPLPGDRLEARLEMGERHGFALHLTAGEAVEGEVSQGQLDVEILLFEPGVSEPTVFDLPMGRSAPEPFCLVARRAGEHRLEVRAFRAAAGDYRLTLRRHFPARPQDRACQAAAEALAQALGGCSGRLPAEPREIFSSFLRARESWAEAQHPFEEALTLKELAACRRRLGEPAGAEAEYRLALELFSRQGEATQQVQTSLNLGQLLVEQGRSKEARSVFEDSQRLAEEENLSSEEAASLNNLGALAWAQGEPHRAIELHRRAEQLWRAIGDRRAVGQAMQGLGDAYVLLGRFQEARDVLGEAVDIAVATQDQAREADGRVRLAWAEALAGEPQAAIVNYESALELYRAANNARGEAVTLGRMGAALATLDKGEEALAAYRRALEARDDGESGVGLRSRAHGLTNIGCQEAHLGYREAAATLGQALRLFDGFDDPYGRAHALSCAARAARREGRLVEAAKWVVQALESVEEARRRGLAEGGRLLPLPLWHSYVELAVNIAVSRAAASPREADRRTFTELAFGLSDGARARPLQELIGQSPAAATAGETAGHARQRQRVRAINTAASEGQQQEEKGASPARLETLDRHQRALALEWEEGARDLRRLQEGDSPALPRPISARQALELLDEETALLSFALGEEGSHLFVLYRQELEVYPLPPRQQLEDEALALHRAWVSSRQTRARGAAALKARRFSELLLGPATRHPALRAKVGAEPVGANRLLIVAEGLLQYLPFAALPVPRGAGGRGPDHRLLDEYEIAAVPSAAVLFALRQRPGRGVPAWSTAALRGPEEALVTVFADPLYSLDDPRAPPPNPHRGPPPELPGTFPRLIHSRREAEAIRLAAGGRARLLLGPEANRSAVTSGSSGPTPLLHFATHAVLDETHPELSGLVLSRFDAQGVPREGHLRLPEIFSLHLPADLVTLSGCRTALGKNVRGDALQGLSQGFFHAGADRLLVSLWNVNDAATADLMELFYQALLQDHLPPAAALRSAQQALRRRPGKSAPYYWGGFVVIGDWR